MYFSMYSTNMVSFDFSPGIKQHKCYIYSNLEGKINKISKGRVKKNVNVAFDHTPLPPPP